MRTLFIDQIFKRSKMLKGIFLSNLQSGIRILYGDKSSLSSDFFFIFVRPDLSRCAFIQKFQLTLFNLQKYTK